jgi:hypothetical protein
MDSTPKNHNNDTTIKRHKSADIEPDIQSVFIQPKNEPFRFEIAREQCIGLLNNIHQWLEEDKAKMEHLITDECKEKITTSAIETLDTSRSKFCTTDSKTLPRGNPFLNEELKKYFILEWDKKLIEIFSEHTNDHIKVGKVVMNWGEIGPNPCDKNVVPQELLRFSLKTKSSRGLEVVHEWHNVIPSDNKS